MNKLGEVILKNPGPFYEPEELECLDRKDEEAHAIRILKLVSESVCRENELLPVYCQGSWWCYATPRGVWQEVPQDRLKKAALFLRRCCFYQTKAGPEPVLLGSARIEAIYKMCCLVAGDPKFFEMGESGVVFSNKVCLLFRASGPITEGLSAMYRLRSYFSFPFVKGQGCPSWQAFLDSLFLGDADAEEKKVALQGFIGSCIRGQSCDYEQVLLLLGSGSNGKSILCDVVSQLFQESMVSISPQDLNDDRHTPALEGARLNLVTDISIQGFKDSGGFKRCISGDPITSRRLYSETFVFRPRAGHIYSANELPRSPDLSEGFYRRWLIINFNRTFNASNSMPRAKLLESLFAELSGIAIWALKGTKEVMAKGGYLQPSSSGMTIQEWSAENNIAKQFMMQATNQPVDGEHWTSMRALYEAYKDWCLYNGHHALSSTNFSSRLVKLEYEFRRDKEGSREYRATVKPKNLWAQGAPLQGEFFARTQDDLLKESK